MENYPWRWEKKIIHNVRRKIYNNLVIYFSGKNTWLASEQIEKYF